MTADYSYVRTASPTDTYSWYDGLTRGTYTWQAYPGNSEYGYIKYGDKNSTKYV
jgi:hypothetical protein